MAAPGTPNERMDTLPRTRASPEPMGHHRGVKPGRPPEFCATLKRLAASVVPRRNVPPSSRVSKQWPRSFGLRSDAHLGLHSLGQQSYIEVAQRTLPTASSDRGSLENLFHFVVVILIETANLLRFFRTLQLSAHVAILRTVAGLDAQPTIGPELPVLIYLWHAAIAVPKYQMA